MIRYRKIGNSDDAVTGIIVALLLFGLIVVLISTIQLVYVPQWVEEHEGVHLSEVAEQFNQIKYASDIQALTHGSTPVSIPISLGTEKQTFMTTSKSFGSINIDSDGATIQIANDTQSFSYILGTLKYESKNNYFIDKTYVMEAGGIITSQHQGNIMSVDPSVVLNDDSVELSFTFINLTQLYSKGTISGYGTYTVRTNYSATINQTIDDIDIIVVTTDYTNAWNLFFNKTFENLGLTYTTDYTISVSDTQVTITITDATIIDVYCDIVKLFTQIGPGSFS